MSTTRFTFDTVFADGRVVASEDARRRRRRSLTEADIESLRAEAYAKGVKAGEVRAVEAVAAAAREAAIAARNTFEAARGEVERLRIEYAELSLALARKLASFALASFPADEVEAALRQAVHHAIGEPRVWLHASAGVVEALSPRIAEIAQDEGYDGRIQLVVDNGLKGADCRLEWRGGGADRTLAALEASLEEIVKRHAATMPVETKQ